MKTDNKDCFNMKTYTNIKEFMRFVMNAEEEITIRKNQAFNEQGKLIAEYEQTNTKTITASN